MLSDDFRFHGFDSAAWLNLLALFTRPAPAAPGRDRAETSAAGVGGGTLVVVTDEANAPCAAFLTGRGAVTLEPETGVAPIQLAALCARHAARRAVVLREGTIEELTERSAERLAFEADYASQWLTLLAVARELEDEGLLRVWPPRARLPLPTPGMLRRALDLLLPDNHVLVAALWEGSELWTAFALRRRNGELDCMVGPEQLLRWTGPLGGDYRRDQRAIRRAVADELGPVHVGIFAQRQWIDMLLRDPTPGAWARAIALREVIISPTPSYVHMAMSADAARAFGRRAREWLGGLDLLGYLTPAAHFARGHIQRIGSVTETLGFNPLQALASRLRAPRK
jgi:hypothetical protein